MQEIKNKFNEALWQDYSLYALLQQDIHAHSKYKYKCQATMILALLYREQNE